MQHQYWITKKNVLRKLGSKEDDCIVSSDAELDAKLELFKSINDSCNHLQRVIDLYQERLCLLAQEENALGRYLKDCGKSEKNATARQIMSATGKALSFTGHQRLTIRSPLVRLHHEVETFRGQAVTDTRATVTEMEKARTEYRAALSWMKAASSQLDPDTGHGLERFRKAQSYVKTTKSKFDRYTLACLQKVDLLAAARCNMFSHALVPYQSATVQFANKAGETLEIAAVRLDSVQPFDNSALLELAMPLENDKDKKTFFCADYSDEVPAREQQPDGVKPTEREEKIQSSDEVSDLLHGDYSAPSTEQNMSSEANATKPSTALLDLNWSTNSDFLGGDFMPSKLIQESSFTFTETNENKECNQEQTDKSSVKSTPYEKQVSWLSLFAELDPLAEAMNESGDRA